MAKKTSRLSHFFIELKRRHVFRVLAMYAGAAFVILEVTNNIVDPLRLPEWLPTVIILLLIAGFPVAAVLSWIFDITPEGMRKTEALDSIAEKKVHNEKGRRKLRPSDIVISVLVVIVALLVYPKIFGRDNLKDARDSDGRISLAVLPFENQSGDSLLNTWKGGMQDLLITGLSNSEELSVRQYQSTNSVLGSKSKNYASFSPGLVKDVAIKLEISTLVRGTILKAGDDMRADAQLLDAGTGEIYRTFSVKGSSEDDFFIMADSLSWLIKNYIEIKNIKEKNNSSIIIAEGYSRSSEAFKYYMHGVDAMMDMDVGQSIEWLTKAVSSDSTYINAQVFLAHAYHMMGLDGQTSQIVNHIYGKKDQLPLTDRLMLEHLYAYFFEDPVEEMKYAKQLVSLDKMNPVYWHILAVAHYKLDEYEEAISCWEELFELHKRWGTEWQNPFAYFMMADAYHQLGDYNKQEEIIEQGNELFPRNGYIQTYRVIWALTQEDTALVNEIKKDYLAFRHNVTNCPEALISNDIGFIYSKAGMLKEAEKQYRIAIEQDPENLQYKFNLAKFLIDEEINLDEGLQIVDQMLEIVPDHWNLMAYKGWVLFKKKSYEDALLLLRAAWEKKPIYNHMLFHRLQEAEKATGSGSESTI